MMVIGNKNKISEFKIATQILYVSPHKMQKGGIICRKVYFRCVSANAYLKNKKQSVCQHNGLLIVYQGVNKKCCMYRRPYLLYSGAYICEAVNNYIYMSIFVLYYFAKATKKNYTCKSHTRIFDVVSFNLFIFLHWLKIS